ncbi:MAG TPA: FHA domain-containing protein [Blastocatellia bacterium]|nr:FHA domain-containing protein [Blastocatellia bacterium]
MIRCNNCGTNNIDGSEYCDECGMRLGGSPSNGIAEPPSAVDPISSRTMDGPLPAPPSFTTSTSIPKPATPAREADPRKADLRKAEPDPQKSDGAPERRLLSRDRSEFANRQRNFGGVESRPPEGKAGNLKPADPAPQRDGPGKTFILSSRGRTEALQPEQPAPVAADAPRVTARLVIERGGRVGREFSIMGIETNIGRWDADSGIFPDVDLDEDDPEAKISRRHARIINHNGQYFIEDLGSTNGTFINRGRRLLPGKRHMLQSGDEVIVGKTFLKFQILK